MNSDKFAIKIHYLPVVVEEVVVLKDSFDFVVVFGLRSKNKATKHD